MSFKRVTPFFFWCQKVLPLTYDDSLSYLEVLEKVKNKLNETIKQLNNVEADLERLRADIEVIVKEQLDASLEEYKQELLQLINEEFDKIENEFKTYKTEVNYELGLLKTRMTDLENSTEQELNQIRHDLDVTINSMNRRISEFEDLCNQRISALDIKIERLNEEFEEYKDSIEKSFDILKNELVEYIKEAVTHIDRLYVKDPFTGLTENIQIVIDELALRINRSYGLTAKQYDSFKLKAVDYDRMKISAIDYDTRGIILFFKRLFLTMISPFDGSIDSYDNIIYKLANLHKNVYTCAEYDALNLTANAYDVLNITAYDFDWNLKNIV